MAAAQHTDRPLPALGLEVGDDRHDPAPAQHALREAQGAREVGAAARGLAGQQVAHDAQRVVAAVPRRHVALDAVGEQHRADAVVVRDRREGEHRRELRGESRFSRYCEPNCCEPDTSTTSSTVSSRSSTNFLT